MVSLCEAGFGYNKIFASGESSTMLVNFSTIEVETVFVITASLKSK